MQIAQTITVGVVDDDGVHVGHVDAVLDNCGREQHVIVTVAKVDDGLLQLLGRHLAVSHGHAGIRHDAVNHVLQLFQLLDAVVDKEDLAVARELEIDGLGNDIVVQRPHGGKDGITVGRRGGQRAQVAGTH